jgi:hypothetical protein
MKRFFSRAPSVLLLVLGVAIAGFGTHIAPGQECRILSFDRSGLLTWTNSPINLFGGVQYVTRTGDRWQPAPSPFWNFRVTDYSNYTRLPVGAMSFAEFYVRLVVSTNDLGSGFPVYQVPQRTIVVDGNTNDWNAISPAMTDPKGDGNQVRGSDITALFLARDSANLYVRLELAEGPPSSGLYFAINFHRDDTAGIRFIFVEMSQSRCSVDEWSDDNGNHFFVAAGALAVNGNVMELSVPLNQLNPPSPSFVNAWSDTTGPAIDETDIVEARYSP